MPEEMYEVLCTNAIGHQTVQRVTAATEAAARKAVEDLVLGSYEVTEVLSPAAQRTREAKAQREVAARMNDGRKASRSAT